MDWGVEKSNKNLTPIPRFPKFEQLKRKKHVRKENTNRDFQREVSKLKMPYYKIGKKKQD